MRLLAVLLDACVLFPAALRDTLLRAAEYGLFRPYWSADILAELTRSLITSGRADELGAARLTRALQRAFEDAEAADYRHLIDAMPTSPTDRHVAAAAVASGAQLLVTFNLKDFPAGPLAALGVQVISPDHFLSQLFAAAPEIMSQVVAEQAADLTDPPLSAEDIIDELGVFAPTFARLILERRRDSTGRA